MAPNPIEWNTGPVPAARCAASSAVVVSSRSAVCSGVSSGLVGVQQNVVVIGAVPSVCVSSGSLAAVAFEFVHRVHGYLVFAHLSRRSRFRVHGGHRSSLLSPIAFWRSQNTAPGVNAQGTVEYRSGARICRESPCAERNGAYPPNRKRQRSCTNKPRRPTVDGACSIREEPKAYPSVVVVVAVVRARCFRARGDV
jgi:hypothetical protein